jgi:enoyl-CoA hydratase/carnithine racemase
VDAETALRMGLVNSVVPADRLEAETRALAEAIVANAYSVTSWVKRVIDEGAAMPLDEALAWERTQRGASRDLKARLSGDRSDDGQEI